MIKKIFKIIKEFILEKNIELENTQEEIKTLYNEIKVQDSSINNNTSLYKLNLLKYKYILLKLKKDTLNEKYTTQKSKNIFNIFKYKMIKHSILCILIIIFLMPKTTLSIILLLITFCFNIIYISNTILYIYETLLLKDKDEFLDLLKESENILNITKKNIEEKIDNFEKYNKKEYKNTNYYFSYSNLLILDYLTNHNIDIITNQPNDLKKMIINILKEDLSSNENDIETLLELAYKNTTNIRDLSNKELKLTKKNSFQT